MSLSYYYEFAAPASVPEVELESFLRAVERQAVELGFTTAVLNIPFDNRDRRGFSRRLGGGYSFMDERLKGVAMPSTSDVCRHNAQDGSCRLLPQHGVVLVVTNEQGGETCFGFFRYPAAVRDINGKVIVETGLADRWFFSNFADSPDPRYRRLVKMFADAGYLEKEKDEFNPQATRP